MRRLLLITLVCASAALVRRLRPGAGLLSPERRRPPSAPGTSSSSSRRGGLPTLNAASLYGYGRPQALFTEDAEHRADDTSAAGNWVTTRPPG